MQGTDGGLAAGVKADALPVGVGQNKVVLRVFTVHIGTPAASDSGLAVMGINYHAGGL